MAKLQPSFSVSVGDWMPRITLPQASGCIFDSWDPATAGMARVYWLGALSAALATALCDTLVGCEALLHVVCATSAGLSAGYPSCLLDRRGELARAFGSREPLAIIVDAAGRVASVLSDPTPQDVAARASQLYGSSAATVVQAKAPVLMLERVVDPDLCRRLIDYWNCNDKVANRVGSTDGNIVNGRVKRRLDVQVDDPGLFVQLRDCLVRRVVPAIQRAFHTDIMIIEAPLIGCYDVENGGRFGRHRDNDSRFTAHRQFAVSINLNPGDEYDGGEIRFPEFGRELYRPVAGGTLVFSSSLLHEVVPVTRGRRLGAFTFLSAKGPAASGFLPRLTFLSPARGRGA